MQIRVLNQGGIEQSVQIILKSSLNFSLNFAVFYTDYFKFLNNANHMFFIHSVVLAFQGVLLTRPYAIVKRSLIAFNQ